MKKIRRISEIVKVVEKYGSKFLNLYEVEYIDKVGNRKKWMVASRKKIREYEDFLFKEKPLKIDAVLILAKSMDSEKILLIKEFRIPINDFIYSLPAGLIDEGEDIFIAAKRELKEETGLELVEIDVENSCKKSFASVGMSDESISLVYGRARGEISTDFQEESELIIPVFVDKKEAKRIIEDEENIDIKAWMALKEFVGDK